MTNMCYFLPMTKIRNIALLAYDGFQLLDVTGPATVFAGASRMLSRAAYEVIVVSPQGGNVSSDSGVAIATRPLASLSTMPVDTLLIAGAEAASLRAAIALPAL